MKRFRSIRTLLLLITATLVLLLVSVFATATINAFHRERRASHVHEVTNAARLMLAANEALRDEMSITNLMLDDVAAISPDIARQLNGLHTQTLTALDRTLRNLSAGTALTDNRARTELMAATAAYKSRFGEIMAALAQPKKLRPTAFVATSKVILTRMTDALARQSRSLADSVAGQDVFVDQMIKVYNTAWRVRGDGGSDRGSVQTAIINGRPLSPDEMQEMSRMTGKIDAHWQDIEQFAQLPSFPPALQPVVKRTRQVYMKNYRAARAAILERIALRQPAGITAHGWAMLSRDGMNSIMDICKGALDLSATHAAGLVERARTQLYQSVALLLLSIGLALAATAFVNWRVIQPLKNITFAMNTITSGQLRHEVPYQSRADEIGQFARALHMFRQQETESRRLEAELRINQAAKQAAETSNRVKSEFLANMSHELRTPLNAILGFSDIMKQRMFGPLADRYAEYADLIHQAGTHLLTLVSDILDLAKIEAGKFQPHFQQVDLSEQILHTIDFVRRHAEEKKIRISTVLPEQPVHLVADARAITQILLNLLSNAIKFTRDGGEVQIRVRHTRDGVEVTVHDNGVGIPADVLPRLGRAFEQASNDPMLAREGTGLGLALVRALVGVHNGTLQLESVENQGTDISFRLPRTQAQAVRLTA